MSETKNKSKGQEVAEADVEDHRKDLGPFLVAAETTRMAMVFTDAKDLNHSIVFANDSFLSLSGFDRAELLGQSFNSLLARGANIDAIAQVMAARTPRLPIRKFTTAAGTAASFGRPFLSVRFGIRTGS